VWFLVAAASAVLLATSSLVHPAMADHRVTHAEVAAMAARIEQSAGFPVLAIAAYNAGEPSSRRRVSLESAQESRAFERLSRARLTRLKTVAMSYSGCVAVGRARVSSIASSSVWRSYGFAMSSKPCSRKNPCGSMSAE
jgi:hypothetical protein